MKLNTVYLVANNDKRFASWISEKRKALKGSLLEMFNLQVPEVRVSNVFIKKTFICYWEIQTNDQMARIAPALTFATLQHLTHNAMASGNEELTQVMINLSTNYLRAYHNISTEDEVNEEE